EERRKNEDDFPKTPASVTRTARRLPGLHDERAYKPGGDERRRDGGRVARARRVGLAVGFARGRALAGRGGERPRDAARARRDVRRLQLRARAEGEAATDRRAGRATAQGRARGDREAFRRQGRVGHDLGGDEERRRKDQGRRR